MRVNRSERFGGGVMLAAAVLFSILPLLSMASAALQPQGTIPVGIQWPSDPQWHNFIDAWNVASITPLLISSAILVLLVVPLAAFLATLAGYALGGLKVRGATVLLLVLMLGLTLPKEATIIPLYYQMRAWGMLNSRVGLAMVLVGTFMPFAVYWMRAHFMSVPGELTEAAQIDGANSWRNFVHIQLPLALPAISSMCILLFLWTWNTFLQALVLIDDPTKRTMAGALQNFVGQYSTDVVLLNAGALLIMAPTILVFLLLFRAQNVPLTRQNAAKRREVEKPLAVSCVPAVPTAYKGGMRRRPPYAPRWERVIPHAWGKFPMDFPRECRSLTQVFAGQTVDADDQGHGVLGAEHPVPQALA